MRSLTIFFAFWLILLMLSSCKENDPPGDTSGTCNLQAIDQNSDVGGFSILEKLVGIWNGPVVSSTSLGAFPQWIVDFRPISGAQVSAKNELDSLNDIFMSFFIVKYDCEYIVAFRNGGGFAGLTRNSYMVFDSMNLDGNRSFYRFADPVRDTQRVYADVLFKPDSLILKVFTNKYNTLTQPVNHFVWRAALKDVTSAADAIADFNFPQKELVKDFTTTFDNVTEAVYFSEAQDPYPESEQPYVGSTKVTVSVTNPMNPDAQKRILYVITTKPLFDGFIFKPERLDFRSRYVLVSAENNTSYNFNYMHPGDYYLNAIYDANGDKNFSSGDYMNSSFDKSFTLGPEGQQNVSVTIDFQIP